MRVVWPPHVDYLRCTGQGSAADAGFLLRQEPGKAARWWRPGWWAVEQPTATCGTRYVADAEQAARVWPQAWSSECHLTRVDIACDVTFPGRTRGEPAGFTSAHRELFTGRGAKQVIEKRHELRTMYIGGRESPVMLRIYLKSRRCNERDKMRWLEHGWNGRDEVWRIEYEFHRKALAGLADLHLPRDVPNLWADGLARIRMCAVPPRSYAEQCRAPTHPWWCALGSPRKLTRRAVDMTGAPNEPTMRELENALDRLMVRGGIASLPRLLSRLTRAMTGAGVRRGKDRKKD